MKRRPAFLRRHRGAIQMEASGARSAAAAPCSELEDEDAGLQKAAAWQWFMRGAGAADGQAPLLNSSAAAMKRSAATRQQASRFAQEAAHLPRSPPSQLPLFDDVDLPGIAAIAVKSHPLQPDPHPSGRELAEKKISPPRLRHLRFHGFQRLLHKLILPKFADALLIPPSPAAVSDCEDELQDRHRHYVHYHHHHHFYHPDEAGFHLEQLVVPALPHTGSADRRRRRHSESAVFYESQNYIYDDSEGQLKHYQTPFATASEYF